MSWKSFVVLVAIVIGLAAVLIPSAREHAAYCAAAASEACPEKCEEEVRCTSRTRQTRSFIFSSGEGCNACLARKNTIANLCRSTASWDELERTTLNCSARGR